MRCGSIRLHLLQSLEYLQSPVTYSNTVLQSSTVDSIRQILYVDSVIHIQHSPGRVIGFAFQADPRPARIYKYPHVRRRLHVIARTTVSGGTRATTAERHLQDGYVMECASGAMAA